MPTKVEHAAPILGAYRYTRLSRDFPQANRVNPDGILRIPLTGIWTMGSAVVVSIEGVPDAWNGWTFEVRQAVPTDRLRRVSYVGWYGVNLAAREEMGKAFETDDSLLDRWVVARMLDDEVVPHLRATLLGEIPPELLG